MVDFEQVATRRAAVDNLKQAELTRAAIDALKPGVIVHDKVSSLRDKVKMARISSEHATKLSNASVGAIGYAPIRSKTIDRLESCQQDPTED